MDKLVLNIEGQQLNAPKGIPKSLQGGNLKSSGLIQTGYNWLFMGAAVLAVLFMLFAGISFITSGGDAQKLASARRKLLYAVIGLVIVILAFAIVNIVMTTLGTNTKNFL